jgi:hypothetical protein
LSYAQRDLPSAEVVEFLQTLTPEFVATINSLDYARLYRVPALVSQAPVTPAYPLSIRLGDQIQLVGYDMASREAQPGDEIKLTLYWQSIQALTTDYSVYLRLVNGVYDVWGSLDGPPLAGAMPTSLWQDGMVLADPRQIRVLEGTPPGSYQIAVGIYDPATMRHLAPHGETAEILLGPVIVKRGEPAPLPPIEREVDAQLGNRVGLYGYELGGELVAGGKLDLTLFWRTLATMETDYAVFIHLLDQSGEIVAQTDSQPVSGYYPTSTWTLNEFVRDQHHLSLPDALAPGDYRLIVGMYDPTSAVRLEVVDDKGQPQGDSILLDTLQVETP